MITLEILDYNRKYVKKWPWQGNLPIPNKGDTMLIHFGDNNEQEYRVNVLHREFDGTRPNVIRIITDYVEFKKEIDEETFLP